MTREAIRAVHEFLDGYSPDLETPESSEALAAKLARLQREATKSPDQLKRLDIANCSLKLEYRLLREAFVRHAKQYSQSKGVAYGDWIDVGIPKRVLRDAGITSRLPAPAPADGLSS